MEEEEEEEEARVILESSYTPYLREISTTGKHHVAAGLDCPASNLPLILLTVCGSRTDRN